MGITAGNTGSYPDQAEQPEQAEQPDNGQDPAGNEGTPSSEPGATTPGADMTGTLETSDETNQQDASDVSATDPGAAVADGQEGTVVQEVVSNDGKDSTEVEVPADATPAEAAQAAEDKKAEEGEGEADKKAEEPTKDLEGTEKGEPDFDPHDHKVDEIEKYLKEHPEDKERVLALEEQGKKRVSVLGL